METRRKSVDIPISILDSGILSDELLYCLLPMGDLQRTIPTHFHFSQFF